MSRAWCVVVAAVIGIALSSLIYSARDIQEADIVTASSLRGQRVYEANCSFCHGSTGEADVVPCAGYAHRFELTGRYPPALAPRSDLYPEYVSAMVRRGRDVSYNGDSIEVMWGFEERLSPQEIEDVTTFVLVGLQELPISD